MATSDEIGRERQRVSEQLARLDAERAKLANELNELEIAERVLTRFGKTAVPKPFHLRELLATVKAVLRRTSIQTSEKQTPSDWHIDLSNRELVSPWGKEVRLTTGEFDLLAAFVNNPSQVLTRDRLLDLARNREAGPCDRTIDVQVGRLRNKLEGNPKKPTMIKTVRGRGYIFTPEVECF
jgi:two-component system OmpR family response regulator